MKKYTFKKVLTYDTIPENTILPQGFDDYIQYDSSNYFSGRLVHVLEQLEETYVFLIYDVDIVINIDEHALDTYIQIMYENNIDRVCCALFNGNDQIHKNNLALCNLNLPLISPSNHYVPADCTSVIWNRSSLIDFFKRFPNQTYASLELDKIVLNYCKTRVKCYGIQYTPNLNILYNRGLTYCDKLSFLHITTKGKFLKPFSVYADYEVYLKNIINQYNLNVDAIGMYEAGKACFNCKKLLY
jgi:hypothetical protein